MDTDIGLVASFGAGLVSFLSPCILPLVPSYLCFLAGTSLSELTADRAAGRTVLGRAVAFVLGFTVVFVALGASASTIGRLVSDHLTLLSRIAGVVIVVLGLHMTGLLQIAWLMREARFQAIRRPASAIGAFAVGLAFGFGWTPCVGPILASVLLLAGSEATVGRGAELLAAYAGGIGVPFVGAALFTRPFLALAARFRAYLWVIERTMGVVLVMTGVLVFMGAMPTLGALLLDYVPFLGRIG